ncbi:hypothetical protein AHAS_Ahas20G0253800 [Arachis hypogaea]
MALDHSNLVEVGCHKKVHHNYCLGMHHRMVVGYSALEGVIAKRVDQILVAPPFFDSSNLMHVLIIAPIPYSNIGTKLKATWVRIHSS